MIDKKNIPRHIAIIMDGNGRWAKKNGLPRTAGHREGFKRAREIIRRSAELGIEFLTLFAFSTENWSRPKPEINMLMRSLNMFLERNIRELETNNIRFRVIGRESMLPDYLKEKIREAQDRTVNNSGLTLILAFNYGSRQEIVDASKKFAASVLKGKTNLEDLDEDSFRQYLYTADFPDPDLLIRTSGELRLSNFLLWQLSYAELCFPGKHWPEFSHKDFDRAIREFKRRQRRFGGIDAFKKDS